MKVTITAKKVVILMMTMAVAVALVACQAAVPKKTPVALGGKALAPMSFPDFVAGTATSKKVTITSSHFKGTNLKYTADSANPSVATATASGKVVTVTPKGAGTTTVLVTATATAADEEGTQSLNFTVTVTAPETAPANKPPTVRTISPVALWDDASKTITLSGYFTDPEGGTLTYTAMSSAPTVAKVSDPDADSMITITAVAAGTAEITVSASDGTNAVSQTFDVMVTAPEPPPTNNPPEIRTVLGNMSLQVEGTAMLPLSHYYVDRERDTLAYTADSSDDTVATVTDPNAASMITITAVAEGTAMITVTASDDVEGNAAVPQMFQVTVTAKPVPPDPNQRPTSDRIPAHTVTVVDDPTVKLDLSMYFDDADRDKLTHTAKSSDDMVATVTEPDADSMITVTAVAAGTATITVTATDGKSEPVSRNFVVTVLPENNKPPKALSGTNRDVNVMVGGDAKTIDLSHYFTDPENDPLTYGATSDMPMYATAMVPEGSSMLTVAAVAAGTATITVTASDKMSNNDGVANAAASLRLNVRVTATPVDNEPPRVLAGMFKDMELQVGDTADLDLSMYFMDPDEGDMLEYDAESSNAFATVSEPDADSITITAVSVGRAIITITAADSHEASATATFMVTVTPQNVAPVVRTEIPNQYLEMDFDMTEKLDLSMYFSDSDNGPEPLEYEAESDMEMYATAMVDGSTLTIQAVAAGRATITVTASDGEDSDQDMFTVWVTNPAAPTATSELPDQDFAHGDMAARMFTLSDHFSKATMYNVKSSNDDVVMAGEEDGVLTLTPVGAGNAVVTVTPSNSGGIGWRRTINVKVADEPEELMLPPRRAGMVPAQTVEIGATGTVNVAGNFVEPEGEQLTYEAASSDEGVATATVSDAGVVTITGVARGSAKIIVTATDTDGLTAMQTIEVTVPAEGTLPPRYVGSLPESIALEPGQQYAISGTDIESSFEEDEGESLTYDVKVDGSSVHVIQGADGTVTITALAAVGDATVTIIATDEDDKTAEHAIAVAVRTSLQPTASGTPDPVALDVGGEAKTVDVSMYFSDPEVGDVMYMAVSDNESVAIAVADGSMVTITPVADGGATVTVTATNSYGTGSQMIKVTVAETPPTKDGSILDQVLTIGQVRTVELAKYFIPGAAGDVLIYTHSVSSVPVGAVRARVLSDILLIEAYAAGSATITVTATDNNGETAMQTFMVTVAAEVEPPSENMAPQLKDGMMPGPYKGVVLGSKNIDLDMYFEDPDGSDALVTYETKVTDEDPTEDVTPLPSVIAVSGGLGWGAGTGQTTCAANSPDGTGANAIPDGNDLDNLLGVCYQNSGTAEIEIVAVDSLGAKSSPVTVMITVASDNNEPTVENGSATGTANGAIVDVVTTRLKVDDTKKVIDNKLIAHYFGDDDFPSEDISGRGDTLTFEVKSYAAETDADNILNSTTNVLKVMGETDYRAPLGDDKAQVSTSLSRSTWNGDRNSKFTLSVTAERGSTAATAASDVVAIIATDEFGESAVRLFEVRVNHRPQAYSAHPDEKDRVTLADYKGFMKLSAAVITPVTGTPELDLVDDGAGYFSDKDDDDLTCDFRTSEANVANDDKILSLVTIATTGVVSITSNGKIGTMSITIWCADAAEDSDEADVDVEFDRGKSIAS